MANKGYAFEREVLDFFREIENPDKLLGFDYKSYRVYGSGRNKTSTTLNTDSQLDGDVIGVLNFLDKKIQCECKHYKPRKKEDRSISVKKEWLDQNLEEANANNEYSFVAIKFKNTSHNSVHYIIPQSHMKLLMDYIKGLKGARVEVECNTLQDLTTEQLLNEIKRRLGG